MEKLVKVLGAAISVSLLCGCVTNFSRVDFKYNSTAHLNYREAMMEVRVPPEHLLAELSDAFRRQGVTVLERKTLDYYLSEANSGQLCWEANKTICYVPIYSRVIAPTYFG
jgi:hypothetical protein